MRTRASCFSLSLALCLGIAAQAPAPDLAAAQSLLGPGFRVPIHTHPVDPVHGAYGLWAAGADYKVSFHDGIVFYPVLGPAVVGHTPLAWRTERIEVGGETLRTEATALQHPVLRTTDWRHEIHHPGVVEAYDVLSEGVEQTFTLLERPSRPGDWVVTGRVTTNLRPATPLLAAAHQEILFVDHAAAPRVRYGAATAIDAAGARIPATTWTDGQRIRLTVDGAWLAQARFPVVLDPLTAAVVVYASGTLAIAGIDVAATPSPAGDRAMVIFTRAVTATDHDAYGLLTSAALTGGTVVFAEVANTLKTERVRVAFAEAAARWILTVHRSGISAPGSHSIDVWLHDRNDLTMSNARLQLPPPGNLLVRRSHDVAGSSGNQALLVYGLASAILNFPPYDVEAMVIDAQAITIGAPFLLAGTASGSRFERQEPSVNEYASGSPFSWVAAWQELDKIWTPPRAYIRAERITSTGQRAASAVVTIQDANHKVQPRVAGDQGRYLVAFLAASAFNDISGPAIHTVRFEAPQNSATITVQPTSSLGLSAVRLYSSLALAFDRDSASHWALAYESRPTTSPGAVPGATVARLGSTGGTVESAALISGSLGSFLPTVTFQTQDPALQNSRFLVPYASPGIGNSLLGRQFTYSPNATASLYGTGCGNGAISSGLPRAGTEAFPVHVSSTPAATAAILYLGFGAGSIPLDGIGMIGCVFNLAPSALLTLVTTTNGAGQGSVAFPLPDRPAFFGDIYLQWLYLNPGANPAGLQATRGLLAAVR